MAGLLGNADVVEEELESMPILSPHIDHLGGWIRQRSHTEYAKQDKPSGIKYNVLISKQVEATVNLASNRPNLIQ